MSEPLLCLACSCTTSLKKKDLVTLCTKLVDLSLQCLGLFAGKCGKCNCVCKCFFLTVMIRTIIVVSLFRYLFRGRGFSNNTVFVKCTSDVSAIG